MAPQLQAAMRMLSQAGRRISRFLWWRATPLYMGCEIEWFTHKMSIDQLNIFKVGWALVR